MPTRLTRLVARCALVWFAAYIGVAIAAPVMAPAGFQTICSASGIQLMPTGHDIGQGNGHDGDSGEARTSMHCPMCMLLVAPPAPDRVFTAVEIEPLAYAVQSIPAARLAALTAAPLPARGPPR